MCIIIIIIEENKHLRRSGGHGKSCGEKEGIIDVDTGLMCEILKVMELKYTFN